MNPNPQHKRPEMHHWWIPGLQIGYEHTVVHQAADFLSGLRVKMRPGLVSVMVWQPAMLLTADAVLLSAMTAGWVEVKRVSGDLT
jgi:hypothetical protein